MMALVYLADIAILLWQPSFLTLLVAARYGRFYLG
jgi:hypothetical protein